ncbi:dephospho-CoA kinase [Frigoribacterium sp. Leaf263]|uniref:dephospho-CoA kinase n=1 Tax=Frigoribacterium sp. Leaf263 TaxID=1736313 RepID=UPI000700D0A6|nr:dephospho-CoA kinase [Frigoribacterium sp. Leaf263]KQO82887.1 dephospho-CoA kinase [Frigoribacterium sp. Leaf263]
MFVCGLTGGIAAGKSTVAGRLAERGAAVIDADRLAREVVEPGTPGLRAVAERFGRSVLTAAGDLDRAALGGIVFADASARADLEAIIHPAVRALSTRRMNEAVTDDPERVIVYDVPLLVESRGAGDFDVVAVVDTPRETRLRRLVELRGMSEAEAVRRLDAQAPDDVRLAAADLVVDASGTLDDTRRGSDELYDRLRSLSARKASGSSASTVGGRS